jgi:Mini-chromosome maintenance replisome factor
MIQDMHNPEYYISKYVVHNKATGTKEERSGKYKDIMKVEVNVDGLIIWRCTILNYINVLQLEEEIINGANNEDAKERLSLFCIPIPAQTKWVLDVSFFTCSDYAISCLSF